MLYFKRAQDIKGASRLAAVQPSCVHRMVKVV